MRSRPGFVLCLPLPIGLGSGWLLTFSNPQFPHLSAREEGCDGYSLRGLLGA